MSSQKPEQIYAQGWRSEGVWHTRDGSVKLQTFILKFYTNHILQNIPYTWKLLCTLQFHVMFSIQSRKALSELKLKLICSRRNRQKTGRKYVGWRKVGVNQEKESRCFGLNIRIVSLVPFVVLSVDFDLLKCQDSINLHQSELLRYFIHNAYHDHEAWSARCKVAISNNSLRKYLIFTKNLHELKII